MIHVRELPPLRLHVEIITPDGRSLRWGDDEPNPANIPTGLTFSSTMPGGYEQLDVSLARKAGVDYSDLARLSTLRVRGPGGDIAWEGRLERTPRTSGDQMAISPSAVGWQAHLDDDKGAREVFVDVDMSHWSGPSVSRANQLASAPVAVGDAQTVQDTTAGSPSLVLTMQGTWSQSLGFRTEAWYDAGAGCQVARVYFNWQTNPNIGAAGAGWSASVSSTGVDDGSSVPESSANFLTVATGTENYAMTTPRRFGMVQLSYGSAGGADAVDYQLALRTLAAYGAHGLALYAITGQPAGVLASDAVTYAVGRWAPLLSIDGTVQASGFVVPHLVFLDPTTAGEIIRQATSFGLQDWAVWDNRTFYWAQRGTYGRKWRARIAPAQLSETGPQLDRLWESVIVSYNDVDGTTRTVGPVGSGADTEDAVLHDTDPENPANQLGIIRRDLLAMGTSTAAGAIELGRRFLEEQKLLDTSGQAQLVGHVMDDHGVLHPYWRVRAGDTISFVDASDTSERRIVRASHDHGSRTCTVDLDAPPEGLDALLARLGVVLVPLGVAS